MRRGRRPRQESAPHIVPRPRTALKAGFTGRLPLTGVLDPIFERSFVFDSYACRKGKGTHAAVDRWQLFVRRYRYVLKNNETTRG